MKLGEKQKVWIVLLLVLTTFVLYSAVGERGFVRLNAMGSERDELRSRVDKLEKGNVDLAEEISLLRDDPATIEALARTELGMVREGETVFVLPEIVPEDPGSKPQ